MPIDSFEIASVGSIQTQWIRTMPAQKVIDLALNPLLTTAGWSMTGYHMARIHTTLVLPVASSGGNPFGLPKKPTAGTPVACVGPRLVLGYNPAWEEPNEGLAVAKWGDGFTFIWLPWPAEGSTLKQRQQWIFDAFWMAADKFVLKIVEATMYGVPERMVAEAIDWTIPNDMPVPTTACTRPGVNFTYGWGIKWGSGENYTQPGYEDGSGALGQYEFSAFMHEARQTMFRFYDRCYGREYMALMQFGADFTMPGSHRRIQQAFGASGDFPCAAYHVSPTLTVQDPKTHQFIESPNPVCLQDPVTCVANKYQIAVFDAAGPDLGTKVEYFQGQPVDPTALVMYMTALGGNSWFCSSIFLPEKERLNIRYAVYCAGPGGMKNSLAYVGTPGATIVANGRALKAQTRNTLIAGPRVPVTDSYYGLMDFSGVPARWNAWVALPVDYAFIYGKLWDACLASDYYPLRSTLSGAVGFRSDWLCCSSQHPISMAKLPTRGSLLIQAEIRSYLI